MASNYLNATHSVLGIKMQLTPPSWPAHAELSLTFSLVLIIHTVMSTSAQWAQRCPNLKLFAFCRLFTVSRIEDHSIETSCCEWMANLLSLSFWWNLIQVVNKVFSRGAWLGAK